MGRACIVPNGFGPGIIVADIVRLRINPDFCSIPYIAYTINNNSAIEQLLQHVKGTTRPRVNLSHIRGLKVALPPIGEQHEIVRRVEAMFKLADAVEKRVAGSTARAEKLTQAILAKAFRGELVPTEAELARRDGRSYESASDLLARIKSERESKKKPETGHPRATDRRQPK